VVEAALESKKAAFEQEKECLEDDLDQMLAAKDGAEACIQTLTD